MSASRGIITDVDPAVGMLLQEFQRDRLYGTLEVKYEAGRVVLIRKTESIKPAEHRINRDEGEPE